MADRADPRSADGAGEGDLLEVACQEFVELVTDYLEGALPERVEGAVRAHLSLCDPCVEYLAQIRQTTDALGHLPLPSLLPAVRGELLEVFAHVHRDPEDGGTTA